MISDMKSASMDLASPRHPFTSTVFDCLTASIIWSYHGRTLWHRFSSRTYGSTWGVSNHHPSISKKSTSQKKNDKYKKSAKQKILLTILYIKQSSSMGGTLSTRQGFNVAATSFCHSSIRRMNTSEPIGSSPDRKKQGSYGNLTPSHVCALLHFFLTVSIGTKLKLFCDSVCSTSMPKARPITTRSNEK